MTVRRSVILLVIALLLGVWEGLRRLDLVSNLLLASPTEIAAAAVGSGGEFVAALAVTLPTILISMVVTAAFGVATGLVLGLKPVLTESFAPILSSLFAIPVVVWYPMFIVWFGIGVESKIAFAFVSGFFPIALSTLNGVQSIDRRHLDAARSFGAGRVQLFARVLVPLAMPVILAGLRIGLGLVAIAVVVGELVAADKGVGFLISFHRTVFETGEVYLGISIVLACIAVINLGFGLIEKRFVGWRIG